MFSCKGIRVQRNDGKVSSAFETVLIPDLEEGEVLIKAHYSSINYKDSLGVTGQGSIYKKFPIIGGIDVSGVIQESRDPTLQRGNKVIVTGCGLGEKEDGGYSELVKVPGSWAIALPENLSLRESMIIGTAGFTAALCLHRMRENHQVPEMGPVLVTGASGGVGSLAVSFLHKCGFEVWAQSGKDHLYPHLKSLGAKKVVKLEDLELGERPLEKGLFGGAIDNLGGPALSKILAHTRPWGNVASVGLAISPKLQGSVMPFILRGVNVLGISSTNCPRNTRGKLWKEIANQLRPDNFEILVSKEISLDEAFPYFEKMLQRKTSGRIIIKFP